MKNNLAARIKAWDEMKADGGTQNTKKVGKATFRRPGSQKK